MRGGKLEIGFTDLKGAALLGIACFYTMRSLHPQPFQPPGFQIGLRMFFSTKGKSANSADCDA